MPSLFAVQGVNASFTCSVHFSVGLPRWPTFVAPGGVSRRAVELMLLGDVDDAASQAATLSCLLIVTGILLGLLGVMLS